MTILLIKKNVNKELKGIMSGIPIFTKFIEKIKLRFHQLYWKKLMSFIHFFGIYKKRI